MGVYGRYLGNKNVPDEKKEIFNKQMEKILSYGGMMFIDSVRMFGRELILMSPFENMPGECAEFHYNYFEDDAWESAYYDSDECRLSTNKIGSQEFCDVISAAYSLYEMYDPEVGFADVEGILHSQMVIGWLNSLLGTRFSMKKRHDLWKNMEAIFCGLLSPGYNVYLQDILPTGELLGAGGTELTDLLYIEHGTDSLDDEDFSEEIKLYEEGKYEGISYPAFVYICKSILRKMNLSEDLSEIKDFITFSRKKRKMLMKDDRYGELARISLILPARVILYLSSEKEYEDETSFWEDWKELRDKVYHDEKLPVFASDELMIERKRLINRPVSPVRTSDYLLQDGWFAFYDTPKELEDEKRYHISDDDRLFWWDGSDEVIISDETDEWLKKLSKRHGELVETVSEGTRLDVKEFLKILTDIDDHYKRIYPFQCMFYDFIENNTDKNYVAAVRLLDELAKSDEYKKKGKAIEFLKANYGWNMNSRVVTHNEARIKLKRYLAIMANKKLRGMYFGF